MSEIEELIRRLDSEDFLERTQAALKLGERGPEAVEAVAALIRLIAADAAHESSRKIDYEMPLERKTYMLAARAAVKALGQIGKPGVPALISALGDRDPMVRTGVAEALGLMRRDAEEALVALALTARQDPDKLVRMSAANSLKEIQKKWWQFWR